jgi:hypothetical protein
MNESYDFVQKKHTAVDIRDGWIFGFSVASGISDLFCFFTLPYCRNTRSTSTSVGTHILEHDIEAIWSVLVAGTITLVTFECVMCCRRGGEVVYSICVVPL